MSTSLLLHFDGPDGSTSFTDSSGGGNLVTANGGARVSASAKFGTGALDCSTGGYLTVPISAGGPLDLSTGDFTVEMWVYPTSPAGLNFVKYNDPFFGGTGFYAYAQGGGDVVLQWAGGGGSAAEDISSTPTPLNTWTHVAIVREGASLCVYVNGIGGTPATVVDGTPWGETLYIGTAIQGSPFNGLIDELRVSKGVALYSANFTPATSAFPDPATVPDVVGEVLATGEASLTGAGFLIGTVSSASSTTVASGSIISQSLSGYAGAGASIDLVESSGPPVMLGVMLGLTTDPTASNSYTNLNYAWYATGSSLDIYESGVFVGTFATYTKSTLLNIVYDGKHVCYYANAVLYRSVPITGLSLFLQICFFDPSDSAYGIDFSPVASVVTPFTLKCLTLNTAAAGTSIQSTSQATTAAWGLRNFQSVESIAHGCVLAFSLGQVTSGTSYLGFSTAPASGNGAGVNSIAAWYFDPSSNRAMALFGDSATPVFTLSAVILASDVYSISYDNFYFRWFKNGALEYQSYSPAAPALYLFGDFYNAGLGFENISFAPYSQATPQQFLTQGNCIVSDTNVSKLSSGAGSWSDAGAVSINGFPTCHLVCKPDTTTGSFMLALDAGPPTAPGYTDLGYALHCAAGTLEIYESGTLHSIGSPAYLTTDFLAITYDGAMLSYLQNGVALRTVSVSGLTLFAYLALLTPGDGFNSVEFGPSATIPLLDTAQIGGNAATDVSAQNISSFLTSGTGYAAPAPGNEIATYTLSNYPYPVSVNITLVGTISYTAAGSSGQAAIGLWAGSGVEYAQTTTTAGGTTSFPVIARVTLNLAANDGPFVTAAVLGAAIGDSCQINGAQFSIEVIKR